MKYLHRASKKQGLFPLCNYFFLVIIFKISSFRMIYSLIQKFYSYKFYGEIYIKGKSKKEILITTYICHPSMANNELSGILAASLISKKLK